MPEDREFTIFTDHKPVTHALFRVSPPWSICQQRHLSYLVEFTFLVRRMWWLTTYLEPSSIPSPSRLVLVQDPGLNPIEEFLQGSAPSLLSPPLSPSSSDAPVISGFDISTSVAAHLPLRLRDVFFTYSLRGFSSSQSWYIAL